MKRRPQKRRLWTDKEREYLRLAWGALSARTICKTLKRTQCSVYNCAQRDLKLPPQTQGLLRLATAARQLEVSAITLRYVLQQCGISVRQSTLVSQRKRVGNRHVFIDPLVAQECVSLHDHRTASAYTYERMNGLKRDTVGRPMVMRGLRPTPCGDHQVHRYPFDLLDEVRGGKEDHAA